MLEDIKEVVRYSVKGTGGVFKSVIDAEIHSINTVFDQISNADHCTISDLNDQDFFNERHIANYLIKHEAEIPKFIEKLKELKREAAEVQKQEEALEED